MMNNKEPRNEIARKKKKEPYAMPRDFLNDLFNEERDNIREALEDVRQRSPNMYLKTMIEIGKLIIPKNGNLRVDHINHDLDELAVLGRSVDIPPVIIREDNSYEELPYNNDLPAHPSVTDFPKELFGGSDN